jgi:hypothetical protein
LTVDLLGEATTWWRDVVTLAGSGFGSEFV